ncbi:MAG: hypothetical protein MJ113_01115 [Lachnospiraceae bacterium]|nr:hypothetical protein [Lachnospiraceae bacterium]
MGKTVCFEKILEVYEPDKKKAIVERSLSDYKTLIAAGIPVPRLCDIDYENAIILKEYIPGEVAFNYIAKRKNAELLLEQVREIYNKAELYGIELDYKSLNFAVKDNRLIYIDYSCCPLRDETRAEFEKTILEYWQADTPEFAGMLYDVAMKYME